MGKFASSYTDHTPFSPLNLALFTSATLTMCCGYGMKTERVHGGYKDTVSSPSVLQLFSSHPTSHLLSLLKVESGRCLEFVNREAQQILGGLSFQRGGDHAGARIEQISRDLRVMVVGGGCVYAIYLLRAFD